MNTPNPVRCKIFIADHCDIFLFGFHMFLKQRFNVEVCYARSFEELTTFLENINYDLLVIEENFITEISSQTFHKIRTASGRIIVLRDNVSTSRCESISDSIIGMINKNLYRDDLSNQLLLVIEQNSYLKNLLKRNSVIKLSDRLKEVLLLICKQFCTKEIAAQMHISVKTVEKYRKQLMEITGVRNMVGLSMFALENNLL
jgi:DNA-binding NarL/FixJ family response regulator